MNAFYTFLNVPTRGHLTYGQAAILIAALLMLTLIHFALFVAYMLDDQHVDRCAVTWTLGTALALIQLTTLFIVCVV